MFAKPNPYNQPQQSINSPFPPNNGLMHPQKLSLISNNQLSELSQIFKGIDRPNFATANLTISSLLRQFDSGLNQPSSKLQKRRLHQVSRESFSFENSRKKVKLDEVKSSQSTEDDALSKKDPSDLMSPENRAEKEVQALKED